MPELTVRDLMTSTVQTVHRSAPLATVQELMHDGGFRHVPVLGDAGEVIGMISDRDLGRLLGRASRDREPEILDGMIAGWVMTTPVETIDPCEPLSEAAERMFESRCSCLPVVEEGVLIGILTESDFVKHFARGRS